MMTVRRVVTRLANRPVQVNHGYVRNNNAGGGDVNANGINENNNNEVQIQYESTLSDNPKDLYVLWEEYEFGLQGRKAAKSFSSRERGRVRYKYHRRKVVWDRVLELIRHGHSNTSAVDEIYKVYGRELTVTSVINRLRVHRSLVRAQNRDRAA